MFNYKIKHCFLYESKERGSTSNAGIRFQFTKYSNRTAYKYVFQESCSPFWFVKEIEHITHMNSESNEQNSLSNEILTHVLIVNAHWLKSCGRI